MFTERIIGRDLRPGWRHRDGPLHAPATRGDERGTDIAVPRLPHLQRTHTQPTEPTERQRTSQRCRE